MNDRQAFLNAIAAAPNDEAPNDEAPKLVYADWLQDRGEDEAATAMRASAGAATLATKLRGILAPVGALETAYLAVESHHTAAAQLRYGKMYDAPPLGLPLLRVLAELFGTEQIDVDDYAEGGCESCDWGSDYGHTIQIYSPTRNAAELKSLVGTEVIEKRKR